MACSAARSASSGLVSARRLPRMFAARPGSAVNGYALPFAAAAVADLLSAASAAGGRVAFRGRGLPRLAAWPALATGCAPGRWHQVAGLRAPRAKPSDRRRSSASSAGGCAAGSRLARAPGMSGVAGRSGAMTAEQAQAAPVLPDLDLAAMGVISVPEVWPPLDGTASRGGAPSLGRWRRAGRQAAPGQARPGTAVAAPVRGAARRGARRRAAAPAGAAAGCPSAAAFSCAGCCRCSAAITGRGSCAC